MRLDIYLVDNNITKSRTRALNLIKIGAVKVDGAVVNKPSYEVKDGQAVEVSDTIKYCSLGGLKLEKAIYEFGLVISGTAIDIGASNGGFTDCLLRNGAERVYAVDVGENALPEELCSDSRVVIMDKTNARYLKPEDFPEAADIITIDVSFISVTHILPVALRLLKEEGYIIALVKPQFELDKSSLTKSGIVKNALLGKKALDNVIKTALNEGLECVRCTETPRLFEEKNTEYLAMLIKRRIH